MSKPAKDYSRSFRFGHIITYTGKAPLLGLIVKCAPRRRKKLQVVS